MQGLPFLLAALLVLSSLGGAAQAVAEEGSLFDKMVHTLDENPELSMHSANDREVSTKEEEGMVFLDPEEKKQYDNLIEGETSRRGKAGAMNKKLDMLQVPVALGESDRLTSTNCEQGFQAMREMCDVARSAALQRAKGTLGPTHEAEVEAAHSKHKDCEQGAHEDRSKCVKALQSQPLFSKLIQSDADTDLGETNEAAPLDNVAETHAKLASEMNIKAAQEKIALRPEPPLEVKCYHKFDPMTEAAQAKYREMREKSESEYALTLKEEKLRQSAEKVRSESKAEADRQHKVITNKQSNFKEKHMNTMHLYDNAETQLKKYHKERRAVSVEVGRAKAAFEKYTKYKHLYIEASAESANPERSAEVMQYRRLATQYLKTYHMLKQKIKERHQQADTAKFNYKRLSDKYHASAKEADQLAEEINDLADKYQEALVVYRKDKDTYSDHDRAYTTAMFNYRSYLKQSQEERDAVNHLSEGKVASKVRYWELTDMEKKFGALASKAKVQAELQSVRFFRQNQLGTKKQHEIDDNVKKEAELAAKNDVAKASATLYMKNYKEEGCGAPDEPLPGAPSAADQANAARRNKNTENPLDAATKASMTAVLYHRFYRKFYTKYQSSLAKATDFAESSKEMLGEPGYTECQYYTKLVGMFSDLGSGHLKFADYLKKEGSPEEEVQFKTALEQEQKAVLNDVRAKHFARLKKHSCGEGTSMEAELGERAKADSSRRSAMSFLQLSASSSAAAAEHHAAKLQALVGSQSDDIDSAEAKLKAMKEEKCNQMKDIATASLQAAETAKIAQEKQGAYLVMLKEDKEKATKSAEDAAARRDSAKGKVLRYERTSVQAGKDRWKPCDGYIDSD